jgi:diamine N-acetyltransferase
MVALRLLEPSDLSDLLEIENNSRYWHLSGTTQPFAEEQLKNYIQNAKAPIEIYGQLRFVIMYNNHFAGLIDLYSYNSQKHSAGVGIIVKEEWQKIGIGFSALELLKQYAINQLGLKNIFAQIEKQNIASIKLFKKCGFNKTEEKELYKLSL